MREIQKYFKLIFNWFWKDFEKENIKNSRTL